MHSSVCITLVNMKSVISKNPRYEQIGKIGDIVNGNTTINLHELSLTTNQLVSFKYAPVM